MAPSFPFISSDLQRVASRIVFGSTRAPDRKSTSTHSVDLDQTAWKRHTYSNMNKSCLAIGIKIIYCDTKNKWNSSKTCQILTNDSGVSVYLFGWFIIDIAESFHGFSWKDKNKIFG